MKMVCSHFHTQLQCKKIQTQTNWMTYHIVIISPFCDRRTELIFSSFTSLQICCIQSSHAIIEILSLIKDSSSSHPVVNYFCLSGFFIARTQKTSKKINNSHHRRVGQSCISNSIVLKLSHTERFFHPVLFCRLKHSPKMLGDFEGSG